MKDKKIKSNTINRGIMNQHEGKDKLEELYEKFEREIYLNGYIGSEEDL